MVNVEKHLMNLYFLALSDGNFAPEELEAILEIAEEKGISKEQYNKLIINPPTGAFDVPEEFLDKIFLLYDFARVILADGVVENNEIETFMKFCERFGFEQEISKELFDWLIELAQKKLDLEQVKQEITNLINS